MELRHLRYFVAVAEELHFGRAADRLHIVQSALSKQIMVLERELGVELLDRSGGVKLTPAGEVLLEQAKVTLQAADKAVEMTVATANGEIGSLRIGFISAAMWSVLPPILHVHRQSYPALRFHLNELGSSEQMERLRAGSLDVGFVRAFELDDVLELEPIWRESIVVALAAGHRLAGESSIDLGDLKDEDFIVMAPSQGPPGLRERFTALCRKSGFTPKVVEENNSPAGLGMVSMGLAVTLLPESAQDANLQGMVFRPLAGRVSEIELIVAYRRSNQSSPLRAFLETVRQVIPTLQSHGQPVTSALKT